MKKVFLFSFCLAGLFMYSCSKVGGGMGFEGDEYNEHGESPFYDVSDHPISTFSIDADGASYANVRSYLLNGIKAPQAAVRTEEMLNYFDLDYPYEGPHPFSVNTELSDCPWNEENKLLRIGLKGKPMATSERLPANFVFLIDVSGSMKADDKLELLKDGFKTFVDQIEAKDRISIVTYSGKVKTALEPTPGSQKETIKKAIDKLKASGGTAWGQAIQDAYSLAEMNYVPNGNNRIILGTDGDFNIGISDEDELVELIEEKRKSGVYLTVLGVGRGNLKEGKMEQLANNGNGNYEYIDNLKQMKKIFIYDFMKFYTVAKDVKVQMNFNPNTVQSYRLIGYENRGLETDDFEDDDEDAGELGVNQNVTALYEIQLASSDVKGEEPTATSEAIGELDFRYKQPNGASSTEFGVVIGNDPQSFESSSDFQKFTAAVASFAMLIRDSEYSGTSSFSNVISWLNECDLSDPHGFKAELKTLVSEASLIY